MFVWPDEDPQTPQGEPDGWPRKVKVVDWKDIIGLSFGLTLFIAGIVVICVAV